MSASLPSYDADLFSEQGIASPYGHYAEIRGLGPVVSLQLLGVLAVGRFSDVKGRLLDHRSYVSGEGVALNDLVNGLGKGPTLSSDAPLHPVLRGKRSCGVTR